MDFKLVYGNYGRSSIPFSPPSYLTDILLLLKYGLESAGHRVDFEYGLCPGKTNILIENFTYDFLEEYKACHAHAGTKFILVATDFITGDTFNHFGTPDAADLEKGIYENQAYWQKRYKTFRSAAERALAIWHFNETEAANYRNRLGRESVHFFPHGHLQRFERVVHNRVVDKDIDVFFSGALTPYRERVAQALTGLGLTVQMCPSATNPMVRDDLVARSKVAINIRQHAKWEYASTSRIHYHLSNRSPMISERCNGSCALADFIVETDPDEFVEVVARIVEANSFQTLADAQLERFARERPMRPLIESLLSSTYMR